MVSERRRWPGKKKAGGKILEVGKIWGIKKMKTNAKGCPGASTDKQDLLPNPPRPAVIPGWKGSKNLAKVMLGRVVYK